MAKHPLISPAMFCMFLRSSKIPPEVRMDGSSDPNVTKWFREQVRSSKRSRYSYAGYPATLRIREPAEVTA